MTEGSGMDEFEQHSSPDFVRITNREVYERLGTVEAKLDNALRQLDALGKADDEKAKRIRALELRFYGVVAGLIGAIAILARVGGIA